MQFEYLWLNDVPVPDPDCRSLPQRNDIHPSHPLVPPWVSTLAAPSLSGVTFSALRTLFSNLRNLPTSLSQLLFPLSFSRPLFASLSLFLSLSSHSFTILNVSWSFLPLSHILHSLPQHFFFTLLQPVNHESSDSFLVKPPLSTVKEVQC